MLRMEVRERGDEIPFEEFRAAFRSRVRGIGKVLALMAPWDRPVLRLQRNTFSTRLSRKLAFGASGVSYQPKVATRGVGKGPPQNSVKWCRFPELDCTWS